MQALTHRLTLPALLLATFFAFWLFRAFPQWDLAIARALYVDGYFIGDRSGLIHALRMALWNLSLAMVLVAVLAVSLAHDFTWPRRLLPIREWNVIFWSFVLGPGILVNVLLKGFSQRARPHDLLSFGGDKFYSPIGEFSGQCAANCSFVSGEVSGTTAFCLAAVIAIQHHQARISPKMRRALYVALAISLIFVAAQRVTSGGHFLSDALLSALLTALVCVFVAALWPHGRNKPVESQPQP